MVFDDFWRGQSPTPKPTPKLGWVWHGTETGSATDLTGFRSQEEPTHDRTNFFVGWGTLALINAGLAQGKGRSGLIWCLLSLVLGPIATFLIVVLERVRLDGE